MSDNIECGIFALCSPCLLICIMIVKPQLILKTKTAFPLQLHYLILRGPFGDMKVQAKIHKFEFTDQENESPYVHLPLSDTAECNRLLAAKVINFRYVPLKKLMSLYQSSISDVNNFCWIIKKGKLN